MKISHFMTDTEWKQQADTSLVLMDRGFLVSSPGIMIMVTAGLRSKVGRRFNQSWCYHEKPAD